MNKTIIAFVALIFTLSGCSEGNNGSQGEGVAIDPIINEQPQSDEDTPEIVETPQPDEIVEVPPPNETEETEDDPSTTTPFIWGQSRWGEGNW